jgi:maleylpyruvate isomerase
MQDAKSAGRISDAARARTADVVAALGAAGPSALEAPSLLPGWSRLTIACHLRYGASASHRMTTEALTGMPTSFYPGGRSTQRPATLVPSPGEEPAGVVGSLLAESSRLHDAWARLSPEQWQTTIPAPAGSPDPVRTTIADLALLRLTEVEVHGTDLDLGLDDWSEVFVSQALPTRLSWLTVRRSNFQPVDAAVGGSWLLAATDGPSTLLSVRGNQVTAEAADSNAIADAVIEGSSRDLLALLLGRPPRRALAVSGDTDLAEAFNRAFPGP